MTSVKVIKWVQHERGDERMWREREGSGVWKMSQRPKNFGGHRSTKKPRKFKQKCNNFCVQHCCNIFYACSGHRLQLIPPPFCWPCPAANPDYPKLSLSRTSLCLSLDRHTITYAGNIRQANKSANSCHDKKKSKHSVPFGIKCVI